jgi:hypothetical protein
MTFVAVNYPEHYNGPIDILMWLYDMAEYRDDLKAEAAYNAWEEKQAKKNHGKGVKTGKKHTTA